MYKLFKSTSRLKTLRGLHEALINEGYFATYSIDKLFDILKNKFGNRIFLNGEDLLRGRGKSKYGLVYSFEIQLNTPTTIDLTFIEKTLSLFGYFISQDHLDKEQALFLIEPKFAVDITSILKELNIKHFYHITHNSNLAKIQKIGLTPRETETTFFHPDDRIYLIWTDSDNIINVFISVLAKNKNKDIKEFTVLRVDFDDNLNYYLDDLTTNFNYPYIGCYVTKNIHPDKIVKYNLR
jgi:hypothetical protein